MALSCDQLSLSDQDISQILNSFIENSRNISLLRQLSVQRNYLTQIPPEIRPFPNLTVFNFAFNKITSIKANDFNFASAVKIRDEDPVFLYLHENEINFIEPGAFEGIQPKIIIYN